ncbi:hypothetical protein AX16_001977 [Volvariella volvacea WC 439]|nr:hypothetical protein AX16_001977 [Volvariella volvacea WC 439]
MAYSQSMSPQALPQHYRDVHSSVTPHARSQASRQRFVTDLSQCLYDFVIQLLPTPEEMSVKEDVRKLLERLIRSIEPDSRLLSFGSTANGFSLKNSDMDLCCLIDSEERLSATDLVTMLGDLLERETKFHVKPLPHARIPIIKLSLDPSPGLPLGIACDIGFENRLALENTRLLMCYAMIDPTRVRTMVLFLKVWSKRRKINSPYKGTLSSYGYVLLVIYFLIHVKNPPVLPNLQQMPPLRPISKEETHLNGYNTWFFDDIELLRQRWRSDNHETVAELLIDFFRYYSKDFPYNTGVASIRTGPLRKEIKGWQNDLSAGRFNDARERNRFCIEDPFEIDYNVARCVTKEGLYTIRGEFMRAARILAARPERAIVALAALCEERKDELVSPPSNGPPRLLPIPPQTPYGVGSQPMRSKNAPPPDHLSPPTTYIEPSARPSILPGEQLPPEHMAPKRGKWTSPPPLDASPSDRNLYEAQLGKGLKLATDSTETPAGDGPYLSSSSNSEILTDEDHSEAAESDEVRSVRSMMEGSSPVMPAPSRRSSWYTHDSIARLPLSPHRSNPDGPLHRVTTPSRMRFSRSQDRSDTPHGTRQHSEAFPKSDLAHRSITSLSRGHKGASWLSRDSPSVSIPAAPPESPNQSHIAEPSTVFYQTTTKSPRPMLYPSLGTRSPFLSHYQAYSMSTVPHDILPPNMPSIASSMTPRGVVGLPDASDSHSAGPETPTPASYTHHNSHSGSAINGLTPPPSAIPPMTTSHAVHSSIIENTSPVRSPQQLELGSNSQARSRRNEQAISSHPDSMTGSTTSICTPQLAPNGNPPAPPSNHNTTPLPRSLSSSPTLLNTTLGNRDNCVPFLTSKLRALSVHRPTVTCPESTNNTELADPESERNYQPISAHQ